MTSPFAAVIQKKSRYNGRAVEQLIFSSPQKIEQTV